MVVIASYTSLVLAPLREGEGIRQCSRCPHAGLGSPDPARSSFLRRPGGYMLHCRACNREYDKRRRARRRLRETPEARDRRRALERDAATRYRKRHSDRKRERQREYDRARRAEDPDLVRDLARIDRELRKEKLWIASGGKRGSPLKSPEGAREDMSRSDELLPPEPFLAWYEDLLRRERARGGEDGASKRVAASLDYSPRRAFAWRAGIRSIDYATVDRAATRHGGWTPEQIYWEYGGAVLRGGIAVYYRRASWDPSLVLGDGRDVLPIYYWQPVTEVRVIRTESTRCSDRSRGRRCPEPRADGSLFCSEHAAPLARVREEISGHSKKFRASIKKKNARPTCCVPGCREPRDGTERFCGGHVEEGYTEEDYE